jgi:hypothetical protein
MSTSAELQKTTRTPPRTALSDRTRPSRVMKGAKELHRIIYKLHK